MERDPRSGLLERERELAAIGRLCRAAGEGAGGALLFEGPAGIGKSRLLGAGRAEAQAAGLRVLSARASELEAGFGFGVVRQLLEPVLAGAGAPERASLLSGAAALAEPVLLGAGATFEEADATPAALHGLYWLAAELASRGPLLLCVDDLQWADAPSLRWLLYLVGRIDGIAVGVLAAARTGESGGPAELLEALHVHAAVDTLAPAALTARGVADVVAARLGMAPEGTFVAACRRATGGNPFLLSELVDELAGTGVLPLAATAGEVHEVGPRAVRRSVLARLRRLEPAGRSLAQAVAVLGEGVELAAAAAYADLDGAAAAAAADALAGVHILEPGRPLAFVHPIVLAAVRSELGRGELAEAHARAARQLRASGAPSSRIALHLLNAEPVGDDRAVADLRAAAAEARGRGAPELAARLLRRALRERPTADVESELLLELGTAELSAEQLQRSIEHLERAVGMSANPRSRARAALPLAVAVLRTERAPEALGLLEHAGRDLVGVDEDLREVVESTRLIAAGAAPEAFQHYRHTTAASPASCDGRAGDPRRAPGRGARGVRGGARGSRAGGARARAPRLGPWGGAARARPGAAGRLPARLGQPVGGRARRGDPAAEPDPRRVTPARLRDRLRRRLPLPRAGVVAPRRAARGGGRRAQRSRAGRALRDPERRHRARRRDDRARSAGGGRSPARRRLCRAARRAQRLRARGRGAPACGAAPARRGARAAVGERAHRGGVRLQRVVGLVALGGRRPPARGGRAGARADAGAGGRRAYPRLRVPARARHRPARRGAGRPAGGARRAPGGVGGGAALVRSPPGAGPQPRRARRRRAARAPAPDARAPLREGGELALRSGASVLAEQAAHELAAAGDQPRRVGPERRDELTAAELRVARMAAEGMTNREIAQALFLTEKTIEHHLSSVYRKLDIRSRVQLVRALPEGEPMAA